jgi:hypothetical protein
MKMKTKLSQGWTAGAVAAILCLSGGRSWSIANAQDQPPSPPPTDNAVPDDSTALPPGVYPSSPLAQVIKLTQSGVSEDVVMAYVANSGSTFNLDPDKIIYLKDIGAPDELVTAMMQRDQALQAQMAASANQPPPQPAPAAETVATEPVPAEIPVEQPAPVTVNYFYDTLAPYGGWVDVEGYGRCWRPTVMVANAGWQPYCDHGHWVYTDNGWYWISDYSWGWAPFHYGRWFHHERFGWCWAPDTVWGPSWVTWRYSADYCGWAPLPPRCVYREGAGFFYNGAAVSVGFDFGLGVSAFTFVHTRDFCDPHPRRHRVESREVTQVFNHTTVINNFDVDSRNRTFINHGIDPQRITEVTHAPIHPIAIRETNTRVPRGEQLGRDGRTLMVNRPHFSDNPPPSNRGEAPHAAPPSPVVGSPYQSSHNGNENNNSQPRRNQPVPVGPEVGSPYQPPHNGNQNNDSQPPHNYQPVPATPTPGQRQIPPVTTPGSPGHNQVTPPTERAPSPGNHFAPVAPVQPSAPNYNSTDNRRYPSPKLQQNEQQNPRVNPGNSGGRVGAPVTPPMPPVRQPEANHFTPPATPPAQPPQRNYVSPRNETPPSESHPNNSQPQAQGNQSQGASAPSSPPAQSQQSQPSQRSGRGKNQNGQQ